MAKKNKERRQPSSKKGVSKPESFTHGMVSDLDPHFQLEGSYSDAQNIRLTNSEGDTFTVENIEGNSLFVDLTTEYIHTLPDQPQYGDSYPTFFDRGDNGTYQLNLKLDNRASIVGHVSYANQLLLMIVARFEWDVGFTFVPNGAHTYAPFQSEKNRTIFLMVDFDHKLKVTKVTDLRVCYEAGNRDRQYPDLNMDLDDPVRIEHIIENDEISRIYWTDNKNPLRTLNLKQERIDRLEITSLNITPLMNPAQPVLTTTLFGSLPVGVYQYCYKYISDNGGESTFSPLSNLYHTSDQAFGNSTLYAGGPKGNLGTQGFQINIEDIDEHFSHVELYSLFYDEQNSPPRVSIVARNQVSGSLSTFQHTSWNNEVENGLEEILIESNTFDVCKDIAIKDNILFAANLRQKRNFISEKEWNVKVLRYRRIAGNTTDRLDAMLTTNDPTIKHYQIDANGDVVEVNSTQYEYDVTDDYGNSCGYGQLLGDPNGMYPASGSHDHFNYDDTINTPMWTTAIANQRGTASANDPKYQTSFLYKYLADRRTPGAESFNYHSNGLGGCRVSFGVEEKIADTSQNAWTSPYISSSSTGDSSTTDFTIDSNDDYVPSGNTMFKTSMSLGGSKDPHLAGDKRGYQRGEVYRFGVQVYDLNGSPGNVLWIGDIETPHQYDLLRMIDIKNTLGNTSYNGHIYEYSPSRPSMTGLDVGTYGTSLEGSGKYISHPKIKDFRLSFVYGHTVPPVDVEWFSGRLGAAWKDLDAYITSDAHVRTVRPNDGPQDRAYTTTDGWSNIKAVPATSENTGGAKLSYGAHDDNHHLFDLYVAFEFIIPDEVCKKISGFRVVRAQRNEEDRRIIQQGLLNQTVQYGNAQLGQKYGYSLARFSQKDNEAFDDDPVFVNQYIDNGGTGTGPNPTFPEQPEYNVYLNGYLGLAENSFIAFYDSATTDGKVTTGGNTEGKVFYWPEREDCKHYRSQSGAYGQTHARWHGNNYSQWGGPGSYGKHYRHSGYFGSYDKMSMFRVDNNDSNIYRGSNVNQAWQEISGTIFTLDSPDSAFGIRPYISREGDLLRIDDILKLTDEVRYTNRPDALTHPYSYYTHCREKKGYNIGTYEENPWNHNGGVEEWNPSAVSKTLKESLGFCTKKDIDKDYSILVGKYYSYDPYIGIGFELEAGRGFAGHHRGDEGANGSSPDKNYGWSLPVANAKEISDGEIIPSGFFKISRKVTEGLVSGFSNNTLGYVTPQFNIPDGEVQDLGAGIGFNPRITRNFAFGAVTKDLPANKGTLASDGQQTEIKEEDYNYDTVSTMQMGLRSILIEVDNRCSVVRKHGLTTSFFEEIGNNDNHDKRHYSSWFAPFNYSALLEHGTHLGKKLDNTHNDTGYNSWNALPWRSGWLSKGDYRGIAGTDQGQENPGNGVKVSRASGLDLVPFKYLCSIVRRVVPYGGYNKGAIDKTRYIPCGNFHRVGESTTERQLHVSQVFGGDTFVNLYSHQKTSAPYMKKSAARWQVFPVESYVNTDMRSGLTLNAGDTVIGKNMNQAPYSNDWLYNSIYSQENNIKSGLLVDEETFEESLNLPYEIAYSNTKVLGQRSDAFRQFPINQFHDMEGLYGEINRIINFKNEIYVLQDSAFAKLLVNPLSMLSDDAGTSLFTGTGETVENHIYISTKYGSRHRFSVTASEKSLYFVDSNFGRLFKYDTEKLISLGDALGQRNYLKYIIKEWEKSAYKICSSDSQNHGRMYGRLDSTEKPTQSRNYLSDNPLNFLGITSIYDFKNKELLVTFHNSAWANENTKRQHFARTTDNHTMGSTLDGEPVGISETLVYSEAINAFTSKYSVAPPQWLTGGKGSFILSPENEINVVSIANFEGGAGLSGTWTNTPYSAYGSNDSSLYRNRRCNPLRLWLWDKHNEGIKTNFFEKKDDIHERVDNFVSPVSGVVETTGTGSEVKSWKVTHEGQKYIADESYIEKVINSEAANSKIFDNVQSVMTPSHIDFSFIDYTTDITHDTILAKNVLNGQTELIDEIEQLTISRKWDFNETHNGWRFYENFVNLDSVASTPILNTGLDTPITSIYHAGGTAGKYFFFDESTMNAMLGNSNWHNTIVNLIQIRTGVVIWSGECILWDSTSSNSTPTSGTGNSHGRRNSGSATGQWEIGDILKTSLTGSTTTLEYTGIGWLLSPDKGEQINVPGKYNNIIRMRVKRTTDGGGWTGRCRWKGYDPIRTKQGDDTFLTNNAARGRVISEPEGIDDGFIIIEWNMSGAGDINGRWDDCIIQQLWIQLSQNDSSKFEVDWIEIGGLKAHKYLDGVLRAPLRTEKSTHRTRGTYAKIKYTAKTTEKFNIFAILAKYRKTY